jgi:hypothetical protein
VTDEAPEPGDETEGRVALPPVTEDDEQPWSSD